jgi:1-acyl-sn-glycerol-3-phosphate acyltransferase
MGDRYYNIVVFFGRFPFWVSSRATVIDAHHARRDGAFILASSHLSPFDVPVLMRSAPRKLDFVSIVEVFRNPFVAWFYGNMNAFPLDRHRADPKTVRVILDRLQRGRVVAMFPEGRIRAEKDSVIHGAPFRPGVARIARMAGVPIIPVVVLGVSAYENLISWVPWRRVRYGVAYGKAILVTDEAQAERELADAYRQLYERLRSTLASAAAEEGVSAELAAPVESAVSVESAASPVSSDEQGARPDETLR